MKSDTKIELEIFINPSNPTEWVLVEKANVVAGWNFEDYKTSGQRVLTPDTFAPLNRDSRTQ